MTSSARTTHPAGFAAALCLVVSVIHLQDQNWFAFDKSPGYLLAGYVVVEIVGIVAAVLLLSRPTTTAWLLATGVGVGPFLGYVLARGPGLPQYTDDRGNWGEPLGVVSLVVEALLAVVAAVVLLTSAPRLAVARSGHRRS